MNYYEHHIGDYAEATAHLSFVEDAAYSRMIRKYYATEKPLPADIRAIQRLIGARSKEEREAVQVVLDEFFVLQDDGWHQTRCDEDIARYQSKQGKARASANARWSKPHTERNANASLPHMQTDSERNANASETHNGRNALQSPVPSPQTPNPNTKQPFPAADATGKVSAPVTEAEYWQAGVEMLTNAGTPEKQARTFLGMLCKDGQKPVVIGAIGQAILEQPADPLAYIRKVCGTRKTPTSRRSLAGQDYTEVL